MKVTNLIALLQKFEVENPSVIAESSRDSNKATNIESVRYDPDIKILCLIGEDL